MNENDDLHEVYTICPSLPFRTNAPFIESDLGGEENYIVKT